MEEMNTVAQRIGAAMYQSQAQQQPQPDAKKGGKAEEGKEGKEEEKDDVVEGEVEESDKSNK